MTSSSSKTLRCQITLHNHEILALEGIIFNQPKSLYKPGSKVYTESCVKSSSVGVWGARCMFKLVRKCEEMEVRQMSVKWVKSAYESACKSAHKSLNRQIL